MLLAAAAMTLGSCSSDFLETKPANYLEPNQIITNPAEARQALSGAYASLMDGGFYGGNFQILSELLADHVNGDVTILTNEDYRSVFNRSTIIFLSPSRDLFTNAGKAAGRANYLVKNLEEGNVKGISEADKTKMIAECKFIRALSQFALVRMFGAPYNSRNAGNNTQLGVPIHDKFYTRPVDRSSVEAVYADIISLLQFAEQNLPTNNGVYANSNSAKGLLAKVYFQMNRHQDAYNKADEVITSGVYSMDNALHFRGYADYSNEDIFSLRVRDNTQIGGKLWDNTRQDGNKATLMVSNSFYNRVSTADNRVKKWMRFYLGNVFSMKYTDTSYVNLPGIPSTHWQRGKDIPVVHLTDLMLIRAECAAVLGTNTAPSILDLENIQIRAGLRATTGTLTFSSNTDMIAAVRREREMEMFYEGDRVHELKRQAIADGSNLLIRNAPWNCNGLVLQIPDNELSGVPGMKPNPEGGCN